MQVMRPIRVLTALLMVAAMTPGAGAQEKPIDLTRTYKPGQLFRFQETTTSKFNGGQVQQTDTLKVEVKEVKPNGDVLLSILFEGGRVTTPLGEQKIPGGIIASEQRDKRGRLLGFRRNVAEDTATPEEIRQIAIAMQDVIFPDKPVLTGTTWQSEDDNPIPKRKSIHFTTTYLGTEVIDGQSLWKLKQSASADLGANFSKMTGELVAWLDPSTGQLVQSELSLKGVPTQFGTVSSTTKTRLIKQPEK